MSRSKIEHLNGSFDVDPKMESKEQIEVMFQHVFKWWGKPYEWRKTQNYHPIKLPIWENTGRSEEDILEYLPYHKEQPQLDIYSTDRGTTAVTIDTQNMEMEEPIVVAFYYFLWMFIRLGANESAMCRTNTLYLDEIYAPDLQGLMKIDKLGNTQSEFGVGREFDLPDEDEGLGFHRDGVFTP